MSRHPQPRPDLDLLRGMDAASAPRTSTLEDLPADARGDLDRILASSRDAAAPQDDLAAARRRRRGPHRLLLAAAAVLLLAVALTVPLVTVPAYAGWQHTPAAVDAAGTESAAKECREMWAQVEPVSADPGFARAAEFRSTLSERRGPYTFTIMRAPQGQFADCLTTSWWAGGGGGGGMTPIPPSAPPAADRIDLVMHGALGGSPRTVLGIPVPGGAAVRNYVYGRAGANVTSVVVHSGARGDVSASVQNGIWAAWWPSTGETPEINGVRATVTSRDGSTRDVDLDSLGLTWPDVP